jgi:hypothetical protein
MTMRRVWRWVGIAAQLYVLLTAILLVSNIGAIVLINGWEPLTPNVLYYIFARDAVAGIGFAALGCVLMAFFLRSLRRKRV